MDMSVGGDGTFWQRLLSRGGVVSVAQYFVMDWASVLKDIVGGLLIAAAFSAWVPTQWLQLVFFNNDPVASFIVGPLVGPLVGPVLAAVSFVCSVGNMPLAAVLWNGGISFGGVVSFIRADLIIVPIILIYRKYYGTRAAVRITAIFYGALVVAGYLIELVFAPLGLVPRNRHLTVVDTVPSWDYTIWLNIIFLIIAIALVVVFFRSGSGMMLRMMGGSPSGSSDHAAAPEGPHSTPDDSMSHRN